MRGADGLFRKGWPHEESIRVPFLMRQPKGNLAGTISRRAVSLLDLPAITRGWAEGDDWAIGSDVARISMPSIVALPYQCDRVWSGVRTPTRKLIFENAVGDPWLFFDLEKDPLERKNLAGDPARIGEIEALRKLI